MNIKKKLAGLITVCAVAISVVPAFGISEEPLLLP